MNTKKCSGCGWKFSWNDPRLYCKYCGTELEHLAKPVVPHVDTPTRVVSKLPQIDYMKRYRRQIAKVNNEYRVWLEQIAAVPQPYAMLTEEQWLEVCAVFDGCALCNSSNIETRGFFIQFDEGGRYCAWNVIPLCDKCATALKLQPNPFRRMHKELNTSLDRKRGLSREKVLAVAGYLQSKIDEVLQ
jgi:DNA-directed RNA polymerase subunit RPC12/RpoP